MLRDEIDDASVDLIYLDPPFNSNASYNILFKAPSGGGADASIEAFGDTWEWGPSAAIPPQSDGGTCTIQYCWRVSLCDK